jgi:hypothetical protein
MPEKRTIERARRDRRQGKRPTTQAGEFVREEMEYLKSGERGVKNPKQAIAIGLSKARRAGIAVPRKPKRGSRRAGARAAARTASRSRSRSKSRSRTGRKPSSGGRRSGRRSRSPRTRKR